MRSSPYFKTIRRFLWIVAICFLGISCATDIIQAFHNLGPKDGGISITGWLSECKSNLNGCVKSHESGC
jgi:hypothetical protein